MVKHVILWTLNPELSDEEKIAVKAGIKAGLEGLVSTLEKRLEKLGEEAPEEGSLEELAGNEKQASEQAEKLRKEAADLADRMSSCESEVRKAVLDEAKADYYRSKGGENK